MSLWKIAWRGIQQRPLTSTLTCLSMALGVALVVAVIMIYATVEEAFYRNRSLGYHLVIGGKNGSRLELVMSTVFHIGEPQVPLPYTYFREFLPTTDENGKRVERSMSTLVDLAVPICLGDNYEGYRVVATLPTIFDFKYARGKTYAMAQGRNFAADKSGWFEGVIGAEVARRTGLSVGDVFQPAHGVGSDNIHKDEFKIVGVLAPTGTPNDRALFVHMEGFFRIEGHAGAATFDKDGNPIKPHDIVIADEKKSVTSILVRYSSAGFKEITPSGPTAIAEEKAENQAAAYAHGQKQLIDKSEQAQAAQPLRDVSIVLERFVQPTMYVLLGLTILTVVVASIGIMVGIYNTMLGRRHEIAVMRALGAGRATVMLIVLLESILLSLIGGAAGFALAQLIVLAAGPVIVEYTGVSVGLAALDWRALAVAPGLVALASVVGYMPALAAYRTDVVKGLTATA